MREEGGAGDAEVVDDLLAARDVAAHAAEGLGEGAHEDVHVVGRDAAVLARAATRRAEPERGVTRERATQGGPFLRIQHTKERTRVVVCVSGEDAPMEWASSR